MPYYASIQLVHPVAIHEHVAFLPQSATTSTSERCSSLGLSEDYYRLLEEVELCDGAVVTLVAISQATVF